MKNLLFISIVMLSLSTVAQTKAREKGVTRIIAGAVPNETIGTSIDHPAFLSFLLSQYLQQESLPH